MSAERRLSKHCGARPKQLTTWQQHIARRPTYSQTLRCICGQCASRGSGGAEAHTYFRDAGRVKNQWHKCLHHALGRGDIGRHPFTCCRRGAYEQADALLRIVRGAALAGDVALTMRDYF